MILGAGPAGSTAARLLATWGHRVLLVHRETPHSNAAESLPPSIRTALHLAGVEADVEGAAFPRAEGNTVWWGTPEPRVELYPDSRRGYHVRRSQFDELLRNLAIKAGAKISSEPSEAKFILDCTGRSGVHARNGLRLHDCPYRTICVGATWQSATPFPHESHTLIEAYRDGWCWSVPLDSHTRYVAVMVDSSATDLVKSEGIGPLYHAEIDKTDAFLKLRNETIVQTPSACDATPYHASRYTNGNVLLVGDAASFIDPLSSFGIKKAITSAWMAAVVVNTVLHDPQGQELAWQFFGERENQAYADASRNAALHFARLAEHQPHPFWTRRASASSASLLYKPEELLAVLEQLHDKEEVTLRRSADVHIADSPTVEENMVVVRPRLIAPQLPTGLEFVNGVEVSRMITVCEEYHEVPAMFEAYNSQNPEVDLPNFLGALTLLIAKGVMKY